MQLLQISQPWHDLLMMNIKKYLQSLENGLKDTDPDNYSMYTGSSGMYSVDPNIYVYKKMKFRISN